MNRMHERVMCVHSLVCASKAWDVGVLEGVHAGCY